MTTPITFWNGSTPLTPRQHADNILGLFELIQSIAETSGAVGVAGIGSTTFESSPAFYLTLSDGRQTVPVKLPAAIMVWRGDRIVGNGYSARDVVRYDGGVYLVLTDHTAGDFAADVAAGRITPMCEKGKDGKNFQNFRGVWSATETYAPYDVVQLGTGMTAVFYYTFVGVAAGGPSPTAGFPWSLANYVNLPADKVIVPAESNHPLSQVIAELRTEIANLKTRLANANIS